MIIPPQSVREARNPFGNGLLPLCTRQEHLYEQLRENVPIIDAAMLKLVRLTSGFTVKVDGGGQALLDRFLIDVPSSSGIGLQNFMSSYLEALLTYGNAIAEMVIDRNGQFRGLYQADLQNLTIKPDRSRLKAVVYRDCGAGQYQKIPNQEVLLFTPLNPKVGELTGDSILRSLPFVTDILWKIFHSLGQNFDRVGNLRYAITYKPGSEMNDRALAKERVQQIATQWADGMEAQSHGQIKDFVTVGDVSIKVIGADNQLIDTEIPVRQMLEQIISKLGIPPFLLGLSWSTTERMSQQQTDMLITELNHYRRILTPVILKICRTYLKLNGIDREPTVEWDNINLQDMYETAQARYYNAQADEIEHALRAQSL